MGHATVTNLSEGFIKQLYAKGQVSIAEVADVLQKRGEKLQAAEHAYEERYMLCHGLEDVVAWLLKPQKKRPRDKATPVIEPADMTEEQTQIYNTWIDPSDNSLTEWDCGDDGEGGEYAILDSIKWKFANGWRAMYPEIELLDYVSH